MTKVILWRDGVGLPVEVEVEIEEADASVGLRAGYELLSVTLDGEPLDVDDEEASELLDSALDAMESSRRGGSNEISRIRDWNLFLREYRTNDPDTLAAKAEDAWEARNAD